MHVLLGAFWHEAPPGEHPGEVFPRLRKFCVFCPAAQAIVDQFAVLVNTRVTRVQVWLVQGPPDRATLCLTSGGLGRRYCHGNLVQVYGCGSQEVGRWSPSYLSLPGFDFQNRAIRHVVVVIVTVGSRP